MSAGRIVAVLLVLAMAASGTGFVRAGDAQPPAPTSPPAPAGAQAPGQSTEATPPRVSYINGAVSFWRPGAQDWSSATINTPLAPGDVLYTGETGTVEVQIGPRAFVRAAEGTQLGLDNQEPDYVQFRVTAGSAALDLRELASGQTVELDTPNAAFTIERAGYYRVDVTQDSTTFRTHRGGSATMTPAGGASTPIAANQQLVVTGTESPRVEAGAAPQLTAWDRWNYQRTNALRQPASTHYVPPTVYGAEALDQYGSWRTVETYGAVWVPSAVAGGWVPYSTGHWIWDPRFGWTWLDDAPWGWAPYHYGRWVFIGTYWAWAPGPIVVRPVYSPALVVFLGGSVTVSFGRPLCWAPLAWGEPVIPWWGPPRFIGVASWHGWGGPRVVNNVVVNRTTNIDVTNITVYNNVHVTNAVVGVPADRFGRGQVQVTRISQENVRQLTPVRGALDAKPVAASVTPTSRPAVRPPAEIRARSVVATRAPHDFRPTLHEHGLATTTEAAPAATPKLVPSPKAAVPGGATPQQPGAGRPGSPEQAQPKNDKRPAMGAERGPQQTAPAPPRPTPEATTPRQTPPAPPTVQNGPSQRGRERAVTDAERSRQQTPPPPRPTPEATTPRQTPPAPPTVQNGPSQRGREEGRPEPRADRPQGRPSPPSPEVSRPPAGPPTRVEPPAGVERPERGEPQGRKDRQPQQGDQRGER